MILALRLKATGDKIVLSYIFFSSVGVWKLGSKEEYHRNKIATSLLPFEDVKENEKEGKKRKGLQYSGQRSMLHSAWTESKRVPTKRYKD